MSVLFPIFDGSNVRLLSFEARGPALNPLTVSIDDLVKWIGDKDPRAIGSWREIAAEEYTRSFSVAQTAGYSVVGDLYREFRQTIETGGTEVDYAKRVLPILRQKGWLAETGVNVAKRVQLIYDMNLRLARASGQWSRYKRTASAFPYLRGVTARDERVRLPPRSDSDHTAFDGIILPITDPFWSRWWTPLGFRCRCSIIQMSRSQLARWKGGITSEAELAERELRLGTPVFASPASFNAQIASIAGIANEKRIPGQPAFDIRSASYRGAELLRAELVDEAVDEIGDFLNKLLGRAA